MKKVINRRLIGDGYSYSPLTWQQNLKRFPALVNMVGWRWQLCQIHIWSSHRQESWSQEILKEKWLRIFFLNLRKLIYMSRSPLDFQDFSFLETGERNFRFLEIGEIIFKILLLFSIDFFASCHSLIWSSWKLQQYLSNFQLIRANEWDFSSQCH